MGVIWHSRDLVPDRAWKTFLERDDFKANELGSALLHDTHAARNILTFS